jgi:uncharacterized BrkB/YihY/UPF0761 family membrane protein
MSTLALLREWNEASARAAQREADRRAALTPWQRKVEDGLERARSFAFWSMLALIPLMALAFAALGFVVAMTWAIHHL